MKRLYLIRHAKSSWSVPDLTDFERPLNARGKRDAPVMGRRLASASICPDLVISSSAKRARKTARIIAREIGYDKGGIRLLDEIYTSNLNDLLKVIRSTDNGVNSLALVGHNHVITECAEWLTGASIVNIPTCGVVAIDFAGDTWNGIDKGFGVLVFFDYPKQHAELSNGG